MLSFGLVTVVNQEYCISDCCKTPMEYNHEFRKNAHRFRGAYWIVLEKHPYTDIAGEMDFMADSLI
jgi:hypothetical protein